VVQHSRALRNRVRGAQIALLHQSEPYWDARIQPPRHQKASRKRKWSQKTAADLFHVEREEYLAPRQKTRNNAAVPVASETSRIQYTGNGSTVTAYTVPFYFLANADVVVVLTDADGVETTLVETTNYVLTGAGNPAGGSLTTVAAYNNTYTLTIYREPQQTQSAEFQATGALPASTLTRGLDKLTMLVQSLSRKVARSFRFNDKADDVDALSEADRNNTVFGFDSSGNPVLRDDEALLSLLSLGGSITGASTAYWADNGERALKVPDFTGQLGLQLDTSALYRSTGTSAGNWTQIALTGLSGSISDLSGTLTLAKFADTIITYAKLQNISTTQRLLGRNTAGAGVTEEVTLSQLLDWIGSAAQGDVLYRGAATWARLAAGTAGLPLITKGAGQNPAWEASYASGTIVKAQRFTDTAGYSTTSTTPAVDDTIPQIGEGTQFFTASYTPKLTTSTLLCRISGYCMASGAVIVALAAFVDGASSASAATAITVPASGYYNQFVLSFSYSNTTSAAKTISARFGVNTGTGYINNSSGSGVFGSSDFVTLEILEVAP
jgi:hypothetical protein